MATPFVQGRLRDEELEVSVATECSQTGRGLRLTLDSDLGFHVETPEANPFLFEPYLDWSKFSAPNIIHDY